MLFYCVVFDLASIVADFIGDLFWHVHESIRNI